MPGFRMRDSFVECLNTIGTGMGTSTNLKQTRNIQAGIRATIRSM